MGRPAAKGAFSFKTVSTLDIVLASLALGLIMLFLAHFLLLRSVVALVQPTRERTAFSSEKNSDRMLNALKAADRSGAFSKVVQEANLVTGKPASSDAPAVSRDEVLRKFDLFNSDPTRTIFAARVNHFFSAGSAPAEKALAFLFNSQAAPPSTAEFDDLRATAYTILNENAESGLLAIHRAAGALDKSQEAELLRDIVREVAHQLGRNPQIDSAEEREILGEVEALVGEGG